MKQYKWIFLVLGLFFMVACEDGVVEPSLFIVGEWNSQNTTTYFTEDSVYATFTTSSDAHKWIFNEDNSGVLIRVGFNQDSIVWLYSELYNDIFILSEATLVPNLYLRDYFQILDQSNDYMKWRSDQRDVVYEGDSVFSVVTWEFNKIE